MKEPSWAASWVSMEGRPWRLDLRRAGACSRAGSKRSAPVRWRRRNAGAGDAHDVGLDHHIVEAADQKQMLDIVTAQQNELPLTVEIVDVDDAEARLAAARRDPAGHHEAAAVSLRSTKPNSATRTRMIAKAMTYWAARDASIPN